MNNYLAALIGFVAALCFLDVLFHLAIHAYFGQQKKFWPLAGVWMAFHALKQLRQSRNLFRTLHIMACQFDLRSKNKFTRDFVNTVKHATDLDTGKKKDAE
jgi:hypothetical protein